MRRLLLALIVVLSLSIEVSAVDNYRFSNADNDEFYQTGITTVTYDGAIPGYVQNIYDFSPQTVYDSWFGATIIVPELDSGQRVAALDFALGAGTYYGFTSQKPTNAPGNSDTGYPGSRAVRENDTGGTPAQYALTPIEDVRNADGSIGALKIGKISLSVAVYDGDTYEAMKKGVGHIASTSCWLGNIGLVGHNRGANANFGKLKELKAGDTMTYTTKLGTRTYEVVFAGKIANNDWSYLQYTPDNRLTLITCVADQPEYRLAVQAMEKS